ncbi:MAG: SpoIVB peptidase [Bacilli bacterium]|nr:SpoIVB peptidase [Bacilli bacterium]
MAISNKKLSLFFLSLIICIFFQFVEVSGKSQTLKASDIYLIPGGQTIGIEIQTSVVVIDTYGVKYNGVFVNPGKDAGIQPGDVILSIDGRKINSIEDVKQELSRYKIGQNEPMNMIIKRDNKYIPKQLYPTKTDNNMISMGIYLRDNISGIGTLTFIYNNFYFGALGHQIKDKHFADYEIENVRGTIKEAYVTGIKKSVRGKPGEKKARFSKNIGKINSNTITGVYGKIDNPAFITSNKMPIALQKDIKLGDAQILTSIEGDKVEAFDIKIIDLQRQTEKDIKGIKFKVTDERLLEKTGVIVQGMSGSPIIQNNRIIGAVTHVLVDDTTIGYGVYIEYMLEEMGIEIIG